MCPIALMDPLVLRGFSIVLAVVFDWALGDPSNRWHPVAWLGSLIASVGSALRSVPALSGRAGGAILALTTVAFAGASAWALSRLAWGFGPVIGIYGDALLIYFALSASSLMQAGRRVGDALMSGDLPAARSAVAHLVARDTAESDDTEVARAAVESLGENTVDGVVVPLFWAALLGPGGVWIHKAASTLDSMVGYKTPPYTRFGTASARLDDALAWVPARISIPLIALAALVTGGDAAGAWRTGLRDRLKHESPNSAHGEAAFAGALGVRLGGPVRYGERIAERPFIGTGAEPDAVVVKRASRMVGVVAFLSGFWALTVLLTV